MTMNFRHAPSLQWVFALMHSINSIVGLGSLSLPWVYVQLGIPMAVCITVFSSLTNALLGWLLLESVNPLLNTHTNGTHLSSDDPHLSYENIVGLKSLSLKKILLASSLIRNTLALIAFLIAVIDILERLLTWNRLWVAVFPFVLLFISAFVLNLRSLFFQVISSLAILIILFATVVFVIMLHGEERVSTDPSQQWLLRGQSSTLWVVLVGISMQLFASAFHYTIIPIWIDTKRPHLSYLFVAQGIAGLFYSFLGTSGALLYGPTIMDNVLRHFGDASQRWMSALQTFLGVGYCCLILFTYIFANHAVRLSIYELLCHTKKNISSGRQTARVLILISLILLVGATVLAVVRIPLTVLLGLAGSITTINIIATTPLLLKMIVLGKRWGPLRVFLGVMSALFITFGYFSTLASLALPWVHP